MMQVPMVGTGVQNEQRLAALHSLGLLDTPAEPAFDRLTHLVSRLLRVPVALVSLVDAHRQFFKSSIGLPEPWASQRETPLSHSFCQYVVDQGEPLIVNDAPNHPLLCTNLAIPDMNVNAYLGIPLTTTDGMVLGSLCAIDNVPRVWEAEDIDLVRDLAAAVVTEMELRRDAIARQKAEAALYESNARFSGAFRHSSIGMALVSLDGRWLQANQAFCTLVGYTEQELYATTFQHLTHPSDLGADVPYVNQLLCDEIPTYQMEKRYIHKDGHIIWVSLNVSLVRDAQENPLYLIGHIQDVTQRHHYEQERQHLIDQLTETLTERDTLLQHSTATLQRTEALYSMAETINRTQEIPAILQALVNSAATVLPAHRMVLMTVDMVTQAITQHFEGGPGAMGIVPLTFAELWDGLSGVVLREGQSVRSVKGVADSRESIQVQQRRLRDQAGSILVVPIQSQGTMFGTLTAINAPDGLDFTLDDMDLLSTLANQAAIAIERTVLLSELRQQATTDGLTQLLNRRAWFEQSQRFVARAVRSETPLSVVLLDADHFKRVNDTYGHDAGDAILQMLSQVIRQTVRISDIVGRYGGEEFVILLPNTDAVTAGRVAERIRMAVARQVVICDQHQLAITVSQGIATMQGTAGELAVLLTQADHALYEAKQAGRNCIQLKHHPAQITG